MEDPHTIVPLLFVGTGHPRSVRTAPPIELLDCRRHHHHHHHHHHRHGNLLGVARPQAFMHTQRAVWNPRHCTHCFQRKSIASDINLSNCSSLGDCKRCFTDCSQYNTLCDSVHTKSFENKGTVHKPYPPGRNASGLCQELFSREQGQPWISSTKLIQLTLNQQKYWNLDIFLEFWLFMDANRLCWATSIEFLCKNVRSLDLMVSQITSYLDWKSAPQSPFDFQETGFSICFDQPFFYIYVFRCGVIH